jgi:hypothetical protein
MDFPGFVVLAGGAWCLAAPFMLIYAYRSKKIWPAIIAMVPLLWFAIGYILTRLR